MDSTPLTASLRKQLEESRRELLDLSSRNRLIHVPIGSKSARLIQVFDEKAEEVYKRLIAERKDFTFLPGKNTAVSAPEPGEAADADAEVLLDLPLPDGDEADEATGKLKKHTDSRLQTRLSPDVLQRRLFDLFNESRTLVEEQGVNVLYLSVGLLHWVDSSNADTVRSAPLLLVPVELVRKSASDRFAISWREEELLDNLSLAEKLNIEHQIRLPSLNAADSETFDPLLFFRQVQEAIETKTGWSVDPDAMCLGFFSFAKFLMYKDLDAAAWPPTHALPDHALIKRLLLPGEEDDPDTAFSTVWADDTRLDERIPVERLDHVVDADGSQTVAIELVREGRNLVIQGPPGTGKSQTITNLIATAVLDGKKVLFLAEKLAALEVVKRRLEHAGLGSLCLELHSNKARKAAVAAELKATWELGKPAGDRLEALNPTLSDLRSQLNQHPQKLHGPREPTGRDAYRLIGTLARHGQPQGAEARIAFAGAEQWPHSDTELLRAGLKDLASRMRVVGDVSTHPWRGVALARYTGTERQPLKETLAELASSVRTLTERARETAELLELPQTDFSLENTGRLQRLADFAARKPALRLTTLALPVWDEAPSALRTLTKNKALFELIAGELAGQVVPSVWSGDLTAVRVQLVEHGSKWYRFLVGSYRHALAELRIHLKAAPPKAAPDWLALVERILEGQQARQALVAKHALGREAFGGLWEEEGNGTPLAEAADWVAGLVEAGFTTPERQAAYRADLVKARALADRLAEGLTASDEQVKALKKTLALQLSPYTDGLAEARIPFSQWESWLKNWSDHLDALPDWTDFQHQVNVNRQGAAAPLIGLVETGLLDADTLLPAFERILARQQVQHLFDHDEYLATFNGAAHSERVTEFQRTDRQRLDLAKLNVLHKHYAGMPAQRPVGAPGTVLGEVNRQRGHKPIRQLLSLAGQVVQELKPVFMMSPLSVAQFLEPGKVEFDLLVIDEASQVKPVDALGAVARCKQIVVVGDDKQLPPTNFFSKITSNDARADEEDETEVGLVKARELESILSLCKARGVNDTLLRWHYRSKHHSLIAVSNQRYYENRLFVVPSPWQPHAGLGLVWRPIDGVYDRAATRANAPEARAVAGAVIRHALQHPGQTLGVAAFSMAQQRAIQDEVEILRRKTPESEAFFARHPQEPFFVKNLENVQGDERDVIFLSVGYGRDAQGKLSLNFGPLNREGGERRLNVLISRARKRCEVFSSITDQDLEITPTSSEGMKGLKQFLHYARTGLLETAQRSGRPMDSPFEEAVKRALESRFGWEIVPQVGEAGFFIDLAVVDPERRGRYVLGIECDGVAYHSSPSARERDRLRQSILEDQGWRIHRLWGVDFFRRPEQELAKIKLAYDNALEELTEAGRLEAVKPEEERNVFHVLRQPEAIQDFTVPYRVATGIFAPSPDPYLLYAAQFGGLAHQILKVESPMHFDELSTRLRELWGWKQAGAKFKNRVSDGLNVLAADRLIHAEAGFVSLLEKPLEVRKRDDSSPPGTRKPGAIPPEELDLALLHSTKAARFLTHEEAAKEVSVALGFKAMSGDFRALIFGRIGQLVANGKLKESGGQLSLV